MGCVIITFCLFCILFILCSSYGSPITNLNQTDKSDDKYKLWLTITAQSRLIEVWWNISDVNNGNLIFVTNEKPIRFLKTVQITLSEESENNSTTSNQKFKKNVLVNNSNEWLCNDHVSTIAAIIAPVETVGRLTTPIQFDYALSRNVTIDTKCYGYWVSYVDTNGRILDQNCIQAFPKWMNEMKRAIADFRVRDIFIPGTHDSGSYPTRFDLSTETLITKYSLTQDDDIRGQLIHGVRYIDLRIGFYRASSEKFFVNHGITRQRPLTEIIHQIIDFVNHTNEIVIVDIQEFPIGFGKNLDVHRFLVHFLQTKLQNFLVDPLLSWQTTLREIWKRKSNIILSYDHVAVVNEFPNILFHSVQQRWGDRQTLHNLQIFLRQINERDRMHLSSRPVVDMAELTPNVWGIVTDKYGGLRKLADNVNYNISMLYLYELGSNANIVAVDFIRGTNIVEAAIDWNSRKLLY